VIRRVALAATVSVAAGLGYVDDRPPPAPPARTPRLRARVAAVHSDDPRRVGGTAHLIQREPLAAYVAGRALFLREFTTQEGLFGRPIARPLLPDGVTPMVPGDRVASCRACHATPFGDAGAGPTIAKNGPSGRDAPHLFGAGVVEMIGQEIRSKLLAIADRNHDGVVGRDEIDGVRAAVENVPAGASDEREVLDFGRFDDVDGDGAPDLDRACRVWLVDAAHRPLPGARRLDGPGVAGYDLEVQVFGRGHAPGGGAPLSSTLRGFAAAAFNVHQGIQAHDPTLNRGRVSVCGARQFPSGRTPDEGLVLDAEGASLDDPDGDGIADELTEGDMDLMEFFLLHHPAPAERAPTASSRRGRRLLATLGCARCHVADWAVSQDRRRFVVDVAPDENGDLRGRVDRPDGPRRFVARGVWSDFRYHDVGASFHQAQFDGSVVRAFRTSPLWGVATTAPYGHDGASLDLDAVIRRHGGEAQRESAAYAGATQDEREDVLAFLRGLVLCRVDDVPCDVDGDGRIAAGERFPTSH
jgi:hypothetical protein